MLKILAIGVRTRWSLLTPEFHMPQQLSLRAHMEMLEQMVRDQLFHPHNHLLEEKNNGLLTPMQLMTGEITRLLLLILESHTHQLFKLRLKMCLRDQLHLELLVKLDIWEDQQLHLLNHLLEERNSGWQTLNQLKTGVFIRWKLPMLESHMHPPLCRLKMKMQSQISAYFMKNQRKTTTQKRSKTYLLSLLILISCKLEMMIQRRWKVCWWKIQTSHSTWDSFKHLMMIHRRWKVWQWKTQIFHSTWDLFNSLMFQLIMESLSEFSIEWMFDPQSNLINR